MDAVNTLRKTTAQVLDFTRSEFSPERPNPLYDSLVNGMKQAGPANPTFRRIDEARARGDFARASGPVRAAVLDTLFEMHRSLKPYKKATAQLALKIQTAATHIESIEAHEDDMIRMMYMRFNGEIDVRSVMRVWPDLSMKSRLEFLSRLAQIQGKVFEFTPAGEVLPYACSRKEHVIADDPAPYERVRVITGGGDATVKGPAILLNLHEDALNNLHDVRTAIGAVVYAQARLHQMELQSGYQHTNRKYDDFKQGLDDDTLWARDAGKNLAGLFHSCALGRRHAKALAAKFTSRISHGPMVPERELIAHKTAPYLAA